MIENWLGWEDDGAAGPTLLPDWGLGEPGARVNTIGNNAAKTTATAPISAATKII